MLLKQFHDIEGRCLIKPWTIRLKQTLQQIKQASRLRTEQLFYAILISKKQFTRIFTQIVGFPPGTYIRDYRMTCICEYLKDPNLNVEDIVALMKYSSASSLIMAFKKAKGITPKQFKERVENTI